MNLSGEFRNKARCVFAMTPALVATISSIYMSGPSALLPAVVAASIAYPLSRWVGQLGHDPSLLTRIKPSKEWKQIAKNMGFVKMPKIYRLEDGEENAHAGYGNVVMKSELLDYNAEKQVDFVFAHELAHVKRCDGRIKAAATYSGMFSAFTGIYHIYDMVFFTGMPSDTMIQSGSAFLAFTAATALTIPLGSDKRTAEGNHEMEFDCDRRAVLATRDVDGGISFFEDGLWGDEKDGLDSFSHPSHLRRIEALKDIDGKAPTVHHEKSSERAYEVSSFSPIAFN